MNGLLFQNPYERGVGAFGVRRRKTNIGGFGIRQEPAAPAPAIDWSLPESGRDTGYQAMGQRLSKSLAFGNQALPQSANPMLSAISARRNSMMMGNPNIKMKGMF